ncbi:MAG: hypothetical protein R3F16_08635 [Myxococcota bacterium]
MSNRSSSISNQSDVSRRPGDEPDVPTAAHAASASVDDEGTERESSEPASPTEETTGSRVVDDSASQGGSRTGVLLVVLAVLLLGSLALNLKQTRAVGALERKSEEFQTALTTAVERIDQETARADAAESRLRGITGAVDTVNDRIASLQEALDALRAATTED